MSNGFSCVRASAAAFMPRTPAATARAASLSGTKIGGLDLSATLNSDKLSPTFAQLQFVTEFEERHQLWGQPGSLKFLYWISRGNLGWSLS